MNKTYILVAALIAQILIPTSLIFSNQTILENGDVYKFKTAPVDPYDIFRGRYVALGVEDTRAEFKNNDINLKRGQKVYVTITVNHDGYAQFDQISINKPVGQSYVTTQIRWPVYQKQGFYNIKNPFNRYYMNENKAMAAEMAYRRYNNKTDNETKDAYIIVRVLGGRGLIENLFLGEEPIEDYLRRTVKESKI